MLEPPALDIQTIQIALTTNFGLSTTKITFLPLGADLNTAVYRAVAADGTPYFVKLRKGPFYPTSVTVPQYLSQQGMKQVIAPVKTRSGRLWAALPPYHLILYPFVNGRDGFAAQRSPAQWAEWGHALRQLHETAFPEEIIRDLPYEKFASDESEKMRQFLRFIDENTFAEPAAAELAVFLKSKQSEIETLIEQVAKLAPQLRATPANFVVCHGDIHGWNLLFDQSGTLFIVDWDTLIVAPKERDLMFIGGGWGKSGYLWQEEEEMFYAGYGETTIDRAALTYYRCERIIEDLVAYCEQIFLEDDGGADRLAAIQHVQSIFLPGSIFARAVADD